MEKLLFLHVYYFRSCLECPAEPTCPYSAKKIYLDAYERGCTTWPVDVVQPNGLIGKGRIEQRHATCHVSQQNSRLQQLAIGYRSSN